MTSTAAVLWVAVSLASGEVEPAAQATPEHSDDARVKRFLGAFTGAVVGLGATLALTPLADVPGCAVCVSPEHRVIVSFAPLVALAGAWLGFEIMGGDGGVLAPIIALAPGILLSLGLLAIAREANANSVMSLMPYLISAGVFLAGGAAIALDLRGRQLSLLGAARNEGRASPGRVALTSLVSGLSTGLMSLLAGYLISLTYEGAFVVGLGVAAGLAGAFGVAAASYGVHRALDGRGTFGASLAGVGAAMLTTLAGLGLFALSQGGFLITNPVRAMSATVLLTELGIAAGFFAPMIALELSHTSAVEASLPKISFSAAPTPTGGMIAAGMRF